MKINQQYTGLEVAVIGMACRVPGADNYRQYWNNLVKGIESIHFFSDEELRELGVDESTINDGNYVKAASGLQKKEFFDAAFFNYRPDDAALMTPAHRIFHECAWEALEDAGYDPERTAGSVGVYAGAGEDLNWKVYSLLKNSDQRVNSFTLDQINNKDYLASLLAYKLNLKGPAFTVNTACSTSLVAIHLACKSLLMGETRIALAGGISIGTSKQKGYFFQEGMIHSKDGHCRAFDNDASGTVSGEGAGVVVLKRLKNALTDNDHVYAIIKGSAINNDGNRKVGYTAPSVEGQVECIRMAHKFAKTEPESISYIEAHGTGTRLGDPIEIEALNTAFHNNKDKNCAVGSVKTNIGHLDAAAGVAGLIKTVLSLKNKQIPASLHFKHANNEIDFEGGPFSVNDKLLEWKNTEDAPLRAGVSSFGIGGTNAHVILEEAPEPDSTDPGPGYKILTVSARTKSSLNRYIADLRTYLEQNPAVNDADMAYTFQVGRRHFEYRASVTYKDKKELIGLIDAGKLNEQPEKMKDRSNSVIFMFPGQGSQYIDMAKGLYATETIFRETMDKGFVYLKELTGEDFKEVLYPAIADAALINNTRYTQPLIFLLEYSLATLIMSWGIEPQGMVGHSIGEYTAACISGVFGFEDALKLVVTRGKLMSAVSPGSMLSASVKEKDAAVYLAKGISVAAVNGPEQVVYSGETAAIGALMEKLDDVNIPHTKLHTSHAFHSSMQDSIVGQFRAELKDVVFGKITYPFISNLTGNFITQEEAASPDYWARHMRETVKFSEGLTNLLIQSDELVFIEVGAGHSLGGLLKQQPLFINKHLLANLVQHPKGKEDDTRFFAGQIGRLWKLGVNIQWMNYYKGERRQRVSLPTYSFEQSKYPVEVDPFEQGLYMDENHVKPSKFQQLKDWVYYPVWKNAVLLPEPAAPQKGYLIFSFEKEFTSSLLPSLLNEQDSWVEVMAGDGYRKESVNRYNINYAKPADFVRLIKDLSSDGINITHIIYSWNVGTEPLEIPLNEESKDMNLLYFSVVNIMKAMLHEKKIKNTRICFITDCLQSVTGDEELNCASSLLLGLASVIPQEYPVSCFNIDINSDQLTKEGFKKLADEIKCNQHDRIVAIRNGKRWVKDYQRNIFPLTIEKDVIKKEGVYLITGGLGNIGFILARYLLENYKATLIITGTKRIEEGKAGDVWIDRLRQLQGIHDQVFYFTADVSDFSVFSKQVEAAEAITGPVQGIIHAAGLINRDYFEPVADITAKNAIALFTPKVRGMENVYKITQQRNIDFVWVTSSLASTLGGVGFASYSAANVYMDHFILARKKEHQNWISMQLSEIFLTEESAGNEKSANRTGLKPGEVCELFRWSLSIHDQPVMLESTTDLAARIDKVFSKKKDVYLDSDISAAVEKMTERPDMRTPYVPPETETEKKLVAILEDFFAIKNIGIADDFFELGGDSLKAMILVKKIEQVFKIRYHLSDLFKSQNLKQVSEDIEERMWINKGSEHKIVSII